MATDIKQKIERDMKKYFSELSLKLKMDPSENKEGDETPDPIFGFNNPETLQKAGFSLEEITKQEKALQRQKELLKLKNKYDGWTITTKDHIKKICLNYNLHFSQVKNYKGSLGDRVSKKIEHFCDMFSHKIEDLQFYIIAKKEMLNEKTENEETEGPILFVRTKYDENNFILIYTWGESLTGSRSTGRCNSSQSASWMMDFWIGNLFITLALAIIGGFISIWVNPWFVMTIIAIALYVVWFICSAAMNFDSDADKKLKKYMDGWEIK